MFIAREVGTHAHVVHDGFPLAVAASPRLAKVMAAHAVLLPGAGAVLTCGFRDQHGLGYGVHRLL